MTDLVDERLTLPITSATLLWCMRMQVLEMRHGVCNAPRVGALLEQLGAPGAYGHLAGFMQALSEGAARMIEVQCVCKPTICADEHALLDTLSFAQGLCSFEARLMLRGLVTREGADRALVHADAIGGILAQAGRFLPEPEASARHYAFAGARPAHLVLH